MSEASTCQPGGRIPTDLLAELEAAGLDVHEGTDHVLLRRDDEPVGSAWDAQFRGQWYGQRPDVGPKRFGDVVAAVRFAANLAEVVAE